ncbi:MAG TPA: ABC transporter ATP-binding protein [Chloroflexota bacterium]|nr:ABC transporter ATP-binding protein [Chloroflexota bacterium]
MLEVRQVSRVYELGEVPVHALQDASLRVADGDFIAITGPSGSGKTTLLQIMGCLDRPTSGQVLLDGRDLGTLSDGERTRLRLETFGFVFQRFHLVSVLTAIENVAVPLEALGVDADERYERARELLEQVGLLERINFPPARLSGGERQRVAIARAAANQPRFVLADEPTGALHSEDKARVIELFRRLNRAGQTIVMVTHDPEMARLADHRMEIRDGVLREAA